MKRLLPVLVVAFAVALMVAMAAAPEQVTRIQAQLKRRPHVNIEAFDDEVVAAEVRAGAATSPVAS